MFIGKEINVLESGMLSFAEDIIYSEPDIRYLEDILNVLYNRPEIFKNRPLYYLYRNVLKTEDENIFETTNLSYDLTVLLPGLIAQEFAKTSGHFHPLKPNSNETYAEYHEVLSGEALYLLQKNNRAGEPEEARVVAAKKGDWVFIPPGYGHVTINPSEEPLVMGSLVNNNFAALYEPFAEKQGAAYYYILTENDKADFVKNPHYTQSAGLELVSAPSLNQPVETIKDKSLYQAFVNNQKQFNFLK